MQVIRQTNLHKAQGVVGPYWLHDYVKTELKMKNILFQKYIMVQKVATKYIPWMKQTKSNPHKKNYY